MSLSNRKLPCSILADFFGTFNIACSSDKFANLFQVPSHSRFSPERWKLNSPVHMIKSLVGIIKKTCYRTNLILCTFGMFPTCIQGRCCNIDILK